MKERYDNLDGLRTISCLCLIAMHIKANSDYSLHPILQTLLPAFTHFVLLFLMISGFGMFCGYYNSFKSGDASLNDFYLKRYKKLLPFFGTLILIDIVLTRGITHVIEGITEATLVFGLLPNNQLEVIGVSWTLGVIFVFYMLFPFFVFLFWTKRRAWLSFFVSIIISVFCCVYFFSDRFVTEGFTARHNFLYCAPFFAGGALVYLFRDTVARFVSRIRWIYLVACICASAACFLIPIEGEYTDLLILIRYLLLFLMWIMYAISVDSKILSNKFTKYISAISMEMYLAHMVIFRVVEKMKGLYLFGHNWKSLVLTWLLVIAGLLVFIRVWAFCKDKVIQLLKGRKSIR